MSEEFKVGDKVRIKSECLEYFLVAYAKSIKNRVGIIEGIYIGESKSHSMIRIKWLKRENRGKEFTESISMLDFKKYWEAVCA